MSATARDLQNSSIDALFRAYLAGTPRQCSFFPIFSAVEKAWQR